MIAIINQTVYPLNKKLIEKIIITATKFLKLKNANLSVAFVAPKEIKKLNLIYRGLAEATDILSFGYFFKGSKLDGELIICPAVAQKNSKKFDLSFDSELRQLIVHGLLHLVGYDHAKTKEAVVMARLENKILNISSPR